MNSSYFFNSSLHPYRNRKTVVMRYCGYPIFTLNNTLKIKADGVMLYGDILNGKAYTPEWLMSPFNSNSLEGYVGLFYYDNYTDSFQILSSVLYQQGSGNKGCEYDVTDVYFDGILRSAMNNQDKSSYLYRTSEFDSFC